MPAMVHLYTMLTESHKKEGFSRAYVQAVAAAAGINISINGRGHDYGIDGSFHEVSIVQGKRVDSGITLDFQLKATCSPKGDQDIIKFVLDADTHRSFSKRGSNVRATPAILVVLFLPEVSQKWLELSEDNLILRHCCYWMAPSSVPTDNVSSVTVEIPRCQRLTPDALDSLIRKISDGENL